MRINRQHPTLSKWLFPATDSCSLNTFLGCTFLQYLHLRSLYDQRNTTAWPMTDVVNNFDDRYMVLAPVALSVTLNGVLRGSKRQDACTDYITPLVQQRKQLAFGGRR